MLKFTKVSTKYRIQLFRVVGKGEEPTYSYIGRLNASFDTLTLAKATAEHITDNIIYHNRILGDWILPTDDLGFSLTAEDFYRNENAINLFCAFARAMYAVKIVPYSYFE